METFPFDFDLQEITRVRSIRAEMFHGSRRVDHERKVVRREEMSLVHSEKGNDEVSKTVSFSR